MRSTLCLSLLIAALCWTLPVLAELRQHELQPQAANPSEVLQSFEDAMKGAGFTSNPGRSETLSISAETGMLSYQLLERYYYHPDGRSVSATLFLLTEPRPLDVKALKAALSSYGGVSFFQIRGLGWLSWSEYSPMGYGANQTFDSVMQTWREIYVAEE